jgi:hypothetical protein
MHARHAGTPPKRPADDDDLQMQRERLDMLLESGTCNLEQATRELA